MKLPRSHRFSAFTLLETMIVMAIIAIVMTAGIPSMMRALSKDDLARAVTDVMEGCKTARDRAILQGIPYEFTLSGSGDMNIAPARVNDPLIAPVTGESTHNEPSTAASGFPRKLGEDVMIQMIDVNYIDMMSAEQARVRFYPNGISDHFTVVMNWKGKQRTVQLDIVTGTPFELIL